MASRSLGSLTLDLVAKTGQFTAGMTAAERQASKSFSAIEKRAKAFGTALGVGLVTAATALTALTKSAIDNADALRDSSIQLGISTETLSAYGYAAQQTGTDLDGLSRGLKILSKNAADALKPTSEQAKIFDALGISVTDAAGNLRELDDLVPDIADAFAQLEDGTQKAALAQALFGKSGLELTEFLNSGSKGLEEFTDKARELGLIVGTDTANAADEFNDKLADLKAILAGFGNQLAAEILPRLIEFLDYIKESSLEGKGMENTVKDIGSAFDLFTGQVKKADEVGNSFRAMLGYIEQEFVSLRQAVGDLMNLDIGSFLSNIIDAAGNARRALSAGFGDLGPGQGNKNKRFKTPADFSDVRATVGSASSIDQQKLRDALSGARPPTARKSGAGGKSEAEREAEQLEQAYESLKESQLEQIALFGQIGEAAKVRYDIENGEMAKLSPAKKDELLLQAQQLDSMKEMAELQDAADKAAQKESERIKDGIKDTDLLLDDMRFELDILNLSNEARERAIFLRGLDADATDAQRESAGQLFDELERGYEMKGIIDDFKAGLSDAFVDFITGAKSAKEAFGDFMDDLFKRAVQFTTDKAIEALFDAFDGNGQIGGKSSTGGSGWQNLVAAFASAFGGGKASGGSVLPGKFYRVNENGTEMFSQGGNDYLMTGSKGGMITPANKLGGVSQNNTFVFAAPTSQRTQEQMAQRAGFEVSQAQKRNG